jgi:23S rRNA pseudouridine2605 synthase
MALERLQKFLAASGVASRRRAEELIVAGRVVVNGKVVKELGSKIDPVVDLVSVDGDAILKNEARAYYLLYKPTGCVTTASDPQGRPTAFDYLKGVRERVFAVGRLDYDAEGAILFTDDGELANRLAHPRYGHARTYLVKVKGEPHEIALARLKSGVRLEDGPAKALEVSIQERTEKNTWVRIVVGEGRFHLVKRLCEAVGLQIQRLYRPEFGGVTVDGLRAGEFRALKPAEVKAMKALVGLATTTRETAPVAPRDLPKAARRHGHGPPPSDPVEAARQEAERIAAGPRTRPSPKEDEEPRERASKSHDDRRPREGDDRQGYDEKRPREGADTRAERGPRKPHLRHRPRHVDDRQGYDEKRPRQRPDARAERGPSGSDDRRPQRRTDKRPDRGARPGPGKRPDRDARPGPDKRPGREARPGGKRPGHGPRPGADKRPGRGPK